ncbi:response regulator [Geotalea uraniireducens]|uniref:Response regulator n=1 Tax=Geotalea uraniireducens TaxID=351604 RepID=A0ABN6VTP6_9BACT|nr:response regulator [Geotalea uraniireducens]BDV43696.1 response regulator [Geotalea uraniireducens]
MGTKLLLADDSITIQKVVGIIFANDEEYELTVVDNGDAALEKAREIRPEVMLVDALMPGKTGYEVCEAVRSDPLLATVPILLMTGAFEPFDEEKARSCGADDFISKPFESQQLIEKIKELAALAAIRASQSPVEQTMDAGAFSFESIEPLAAAEEPAPAVTFGEAEAFASADAAAQSEGSFFAVEEAAPADDLWGAFELEEEVVGEIVTADEGEEVVEAAPFALEQSAAVELEPSPAAAVTTEEFGLPATDFVFTEEEPPAFAVAEEESLTVSAGEPAAFTGAFAVGMVEQPEEGDLAEDLAASTAAFAAEMPGADFGVPPADEFEAPVAVSPEPDAPVAAASDGGTLTITEAQLAAAIAKISREIIERIAWEVVPDLAETLIKEEIRRIKAGTE